MSLLRKVKSDNMDTREFYKRQKEFEAEIGKFTIDFEHAFNYIKQSIIQILMLNGLKDEEYGRIILSKFNADPLRLIFQSVANHYYTQKSDLTKIKNIINKTSDLIIIRNRFVHSYWIIGISENEHEDIAIGIKDKRVKSGMNSSEWEFGKDDFNKINKNCEMVQELHYQIYDELKKNNKTLDHIEDVMIEKVDFKEYLKLL